MSESWRPVVGFPGYEVSDLGRVRSARKILRSGTMSEGYQLVSLRRDGKGHSRLVHHVVLEAFVGPRPVGMQARHVNEREKGNNRLDNLAWGTPRENEADKIRHGTSQHGERNHRAKLTNEQADTIRASSDSGVSLAAKYGVSEPVVSAIRHGRKYIKPTEEK